MVSAPTEWTQVVKDSVPPYSLFQKPIEKSQQDDRDYRILKLANGLEAMIVHDSKTDKAAASLDVAVGHLHDPVSVFNFPANSTRSLMRKGYRMMSLDWLTFVNICCSW
jgi:hypothetical protein